ncbi:glycosyltransferase [Winogradskyella jejuensis]|uniref:Glycosyltransferase, catalytic subunit of cellulose synthase and poly-beta-1,6-N-acetylglucosamine synthase n=1 Tax=Winogradskyella jejuensis TaxID=1089305 RepID=A0A1M5VNX4_9FLAO|nr:glycosyltransferase [Winogradskyella jejuensis]SHH76910.1 Glycosyltransferase, catalytic subunit of cellulose synthase and poly-beta-1,6-N-acetylglucosamine synthase [Winogradskyella jejuensis]
MEQLSYSFIIPVFNRPNEIEELLESFSNLAGNFKYEIVIVEDGSSQTSEAVVNTYKSKLNISYYFKANSGPGDSRNYGMQKAKGNYFIILDSDVILPSEYLVEVDIFLKASFFHCFGGPDAAHQSFSRLQKAINFAMTSFFTTGGIRGGDDSQKDFQPRSFNLGLSKEAFEASKGFGKIHPGEDPDLVLRLWDLDYKTTLIKKAFVYHKRRISWQKFYKQVNKFGMVRPILNKWHPNSKKITYWFPSLFIIGFLFALIAAFLGIYYPLIIYATYFLVIFISALISTKSLNIALMSLIAVCIQFYGYGTGFLHSTLKLWSTNKKAESIFPNLFFK